MKRRDLIIDATAFVIGVFILVSCGRDGRSGTARDGAAAAKPQKQESAGKPMAKETTQSKTETIAEAKVEKARGDEARLQAKGKLIYYYLPG